MSYILYKGAWVFNGSPCKEEKIVKHKAEEMLKRGGYLLRNIYDFDCETPTEFYYVIKDSFGGLEELSSRVRNQVRKSLKTYDFRLVTTQAILEVGLEIFNTALSHYKVKAHTITQDQFEKRIEAESNKNADFWVAYEKTTGKAVALAINNKFTDCCNYSTLKANPAYLNSTYPYYGLLFEMNRYYLQEQHFKFVNDGARSLTEHSNIQPFLIKKFGFRKAFCKLDIYYAPLFGVIVKMLYPLRNIIPVLKVKSILRMEEFSRKST